MATSGSDAAADDESVDARLTRDGGVSYLHIPAVDARQSAEFYETVFGWEVRGKDTNRPSFDDGTEGNLRVGTFRDPAGNVIGLWQEA